MQYNSSINIYKDLFIPPKNYKIDWVEITTWSLAKDFLRLIPAMIIAANQEVPPIVLKHPNKYIKLAKSERKEPEDEDLRKKGCCFHVFYDGKVNIEQEIESYFRTPKGLDFHNYCHQIVHWSVPKTPIAFEQRESRIDRYMSHLVRKRLALRYPKAKMWGSLDCKLSSCNSCESSNCESLMKAAEKDKKSKKPLFPYWYVEKEKEYWPDFIRVICAMPNSRESKYFAKLKNALEEYNYYLGPNYQENKKTSRNLCPLFHKKEVNNR